MSDENEMRKIVADVAAAYFNNSHVTPAEIPTVINQIASSLLAVGAPAVTAATEPASEVPAQTKATPSQIRKSITREAIISFEDNKPYRTLRRHLAARDLTPQQYREKWGLPKDYPMVAPSYSEARATMARSIGLGALGASRRAQREAQPAAAAAAAPEPRMSAEALAQSAPPKAKRQAKPRKSPARGRRSKAAEAPSS
jgi:predicted transcriptional regulator